MNLTTQDTQPNLIIPYGYCHCGCGIKTKLLKRNDNRYGHKKGEPYKYVKAHQFYKPRIMLNDAMPFKIDGEYCRLIPLTRGLWSIVTGSDYDDLVRYRWVALKSTKTWYAARYIYNRQGKQQILFMHTALTGLKGIDHKNRCSLDNRRSNLREATQSQQGMNSVKERRDKNPDMIGVETLSTKHGRKYRARITANQVIYRLGTFATSVEAHAAYRKAAAKLFGDFAWFLN